MCWLCAGAGAWEGHMQISRQHSLHTRRCAGRHIGEALIKFLPDPQDGWEERSTQADKLQSAYAQSQLPPEIINDLFLLQSLSNKDAHHNIGAARFQPADKPRVANASYRVCRHLERLVAKQFPEDFARAQEWLRTAPARPTRPDGAPPVRLPRKLSLHAQAQHPDSNPPMRAQNTRSTLSRASARACALTEMHTTASSRAPAGSS